MPFQSSERAKPPSAKQSIAAFVMTLLRFRTVLSLAHDMSTCMCRLMSRVYRWRKRTSNSFLPISDSGFPAKWAWPYRLRYLLNASVTVSLNPDFVFSGIMIPPHLQGRAYLESGRLCCGYGSMCDLHPLKGGGGQACRISWRVLSRNAIKGNRTFQVALFDHPARQAAQPRRLRLKRPPAGLGSLPRGVVKKGNLKCPVSFYRITG